MSVEDIIADMARAWNAGDGAGWAKHFAEDADFADVVGRIQRGRETIATEHQKIFDTIYQGSHLEYWVTDSRPIGEDILLVHTESTLDVPSGPREGRFEAIQTKVIKGDKIVAFQNTGKIGIANFTKHDSELEKLSPQEWRQKNG
ncbi:uncharacterized protein (TIGR02246 family) [Herbihabitans rhizosphaerae]|uniref:Uncharacterized protein (TIGR02246 family) n=1 Tax=Herbihabitans rhizosphaerae TaxID=1872711 RepID=A0A4Q7L6Q2_9PSEU|nr:SgcJ/EcaC family oxidoreductase [Herbihabitans rhizosphaerae]RZS44946.1 uncharacterized protein (TIGR02246 family) [Herbihabitans rhizosphaerae]